MFGILSEIKDKQKELIKYCLKYRNGGRINNAVKMIGYSLNHCNGDVEDAKFAALLLNTLIDEV